MKKYAYGVLIGVLSVTSAASAQTAVRLGGQVKLGVDHITVKGNGQSNSASRLSNNTSFWYIDAREDLGGGTNAYVRLEWDFSADTGTSGAGRNFFIGMGNPSWGKLQMGRQSVYFSHHWSVVDPHGSFDAGPNGVNSLNVLGTINGSGFAGSFMNNTIRYEAPNLAGFSGMVSYSFDAESADSSRNRTMYINPTYTRGPFKVGLYHMTRNSQGNLLGQTVGTLDQRANRIALGYNDKGLRVGLVVDRNKVIDTATGVSQHRLAYALPASYASGPHRFSATWGQALSTRVDGNKLDDSGVKMLSLSYQYAFSKRTQIGVAVAELRNGRNGRYNFWLGGLGGMQLPVAQAGSNTRLIYAGMKHMF